ANPLRRDVLAVGPEYYHFAEVELGILGSVTVTESHEPVLRPVEDAVIRAARNAESVRGLMNWIRYPYYEVERLEDGYRITIQDMRYARPGEVANLGHGVVELDEDLRPRQE
ncbi:MAG: metal-dependent hydrolase, partial [Bradymonadaceae bacterium]